MLQLAEIWTGSADFLDRGGDVLKAIVVVTFFMWTLILERFWFLGRGYRLPVQRMIEDWKSRVDKTSWCARQIRREMLSRITDELNRGIPLIKTLVAVCPLLGLLGTVTGMIEVFDVMAIAGSGNPRAMASGVSRATIPTMAGMVASLSGFVISVQLQRSARAAAEHAADQLVPGTVG